MFRTLCAAADACVVSAALFGAYAIRFDSGWIEIPLGVPDHTSYLNLGAVAVPLFLAILKLRGLYEPRRGEPVWIESVELLKAAVLGTLILAAATFFLRALDVSRLSLAIFGGLTGAGLVAFRAALRAMLREARRRGYNQRAVLIVGTGNLATEINKRFSAHPEAGFLVIGTLGPKRTGSGLPPALGAYAEAARIVERFQIDQVIIALDRSDPTDPIKLIELLRDTTASVRIAPDLLGLATLNAAPEDFDGLPLICLDETPILGWNVVQKRSLDLVVSSVGLVLCAPLFLAIAAAVKLTSPGGPILYRQRRMSLDGRCFTMLKFRTMVPDAEAVTGPRWAIKDDPRCTPLGRILRRMNLDELPQLWNVFTGEMSLVGPRPERPELIQDFRKRFPGYMQRHKVKGGLTGLAQVRGCRGNTPITDRLEYDMDYARNWSIGLDLKIIFLTFVYGFRDPNAY